MWYRVFTWVFDRGINAMLTIAAVLSIRQQRKTAAEQRVFCCSFARWIARGPGTLRNSTPRSLIIRCKEQQKTAKLDSPNLREVRQGCTTNESNQMR
jgi:hypothetical protein